MASEKGFMVVLNIVCNIAIALLMLHTGVLESGSFSEGEGTIWLTNVQCNGTERRLADCAITLNATEMCTHSQDVAIQCITGTKTIVCQQAEKIDLYSGH